MATSKQIGAIYGLGTKCGLYEKGNPRDNLHNFVWQLTGKLSIRELSADEAARVIRHLKDYHRAMTTDPNINTLPTTKQQRDKAFGLMTELASLDETSSTASVRQRLAGVMEKTLGICIDQSRDIFNGITPEQCEKVIEQLKRYVRSTKRKKSKLEEKINESK
jgi:hypothetical protein